jgi:hypothetical protein
MKRANQVNCTIALLLVILCGCSFLHSIPRDMPEDFSIILSYGASQANHKNKLDTKTGKLYKDLVMDGVATTDIELGKEKLVEIYKLIQGTGVINYPSEYSPPYQDNPEPNKQIFVTPNTEYILEIFYSGTIFKIHWNDSNYSQAKKAIDLRDCFEKIIRIIEQTEEFKKLPEPKGGYA